MAEPGESGAPEGGADPHIAEATRMGWKPLEQFRGDPEQWVNAETFVERGRQVMPILKKNNEQLLHQLDTERTARQALEGTVGELRATIQDLTKLQVAEVKRQVDAEVTRLRAEKRVAIEAGEHALAAELDERLDEARDKQKTVAASPPPPPPAPAPKPAVEPWAQAFADENPWLNGTTKEDKKRTALFLAIADTLHKETGQRGKVLLEAAKVELEETLPTPGNPSKLEGAKGGDGGSRQASSNGKKGFTSLPADVQAFAKSEEKKYVGPNKAFKTPAEWHKHYAEIYLAGE